MSRVVIMFMVFLSWIAFSKVEGTFYPSHYFLFAPHLKEILPGYLDEHCKYITYMGLVWIIYFQERVYKKEMKLAAWIITGRWIDYILEGNTGHSINSHLISYDTVACIIFGVATLMASGLWTNSFLGR